MNKKKMKICLVLILVLIECISLTLTIKSFSNRNLEEIKEEHKVNNKKFSMYIKNESGTYVPYNDTNLFPEGYGLNLEKSSCVDTNGKKAENVLVNNGDSITITSNKTVYCYLYLDLITDDVTISIKTDGKSGVMPSSGTYTNSASCNSGSIAWSDKYQRIEIGYLSKQAICNLTFTKDTSGKTLLIDEVESKATTVSLTNNAGTTETSNRYTGKQPDNWIWFNNEMWRIIGSIPVCLNSSCSSKENLVKIIREVSIGGLAFDGVSVSNTTWGTNSLYTLLNNNYYGKKDATGASPCYTSSNSSFSYYGLCNYIEKGISSDATDYYGKMIKEVYWNIGAVSVSNTIEAAYGLETATISSVSSKIGLMTASDYGYASGQTTILGESLSSYVGSNWMYSQGYEWTVTKSGSNILVINSQGRLYNYSAVSGASVRPVVYLDSSVYLTSGDGTITNPYIVGM